MATTIDKLIEAADRVWYAHRKYGPLHDGRPEGEAIEQALLDLRVAYHDAKQTASHEREALLQIINALNAHPEPIHYKVREAIVRARRVIEENDSVVED